MSFKTVKIVYFIIFCYGYYFRINTRYYYQNIADGHTQWQYPSKKFDCPTSSPVRINTPPPPNISEQNISHPEPVDMDIEEDNHKEDTKIIVVRIKRQAGSICFIYFFSFEFNFL